MRRTDLAATRRRRQASGGQRHGGLAAQHRARRRGRRHRVPARGPLTRKSNMGHIEATRELAANPEALWATVSDLANWGEWFTVHEKWLEEPPAELCEGTKLTAKIVMLGMANKIEWTIEAVDAPRSLVLGATG